MSSEGSALKVLVVDDCADTLQLMVSLLQRRGHTASTAPSAEAALSLFDASCLFDLVLVDCGLPDMDGLELARRMRAAGTAATIVAVTGNSRQQDRVAALSAGCDEFVTKPLGRRQLESLLAWAVGRRATARR